MKRKLIIPLFTISILCSSFGTAMADADYQNGGHYTDRENLTWTTNEGQTLVIGRGPIYADEHPEITDLEYLLKEAVRYPEETGTVVLNSQGQPKDNYDAAIVAELREFVTSFDWIHSDELTRAQKVHDRIANGSNGNFYQEPNGSFSVLMNGYGMCGDFSEEFAKLCEYVGLECVLYTPSEKHQACLLKIGEQWLATDPTGGDPFISNGKTHPVDFETEYHRYEKEAAAKAQQFIDENPDNPAAILMEMNRQLAIGEITEEEYDAKYMEMFGYLFEK